MKSSRSVFGILLALLCWAGTMQPVAAQDKKPVKLEHLFNKTFRAESIRQVNWMNDGRYYTDLEQTNGTTELRKYDITTGDYDVLVTAEELVPEGREQHIELDRYFFSADEQKLLIASQWESIWRRSSKAYFYVYNLETGRLRPLSDKPGKQQYARFSPKGDRVAFVRNNNLFWVDLSTGEEHQVTTDGRKNHIINGAADWVYEEEFSFAKAWHWSPDGNRIAFYRFNESRVKQYSIPMYKGGKYPDMLTYKYPKAGEQNSIVKIGVYDIESDSTTWMEVGAENDQYIVRIKWTQSPDKLAISRMNRLQNHRDIMLANAETGTTEIIKTEQNDAWIDESDALTFLENGKQFIYESEESGYNQLYLYDMQGNLVRQLTKGNWEVTNFLGVDEDKGRLYFISTEASPLQRQMYSIGLDGQDKRRLTEGVGWHSINMSPDHRYYIENFSNDQAPPVYTLHRADGKQLRMLEDNHELKQRISEYAFPHKEYTSIKLPHTDSLNAWFMKPVDFDSTRKYPVLMYVYGGPGSQTVSRRFSTGQRAMWHRYLASQGYIIFSIDNRGTGARGYQFEKQVYKQLGQYETTDQINAAQYLAKKSWVDADRIGIWGWSYGGYMTAMALTHGPETFDMGISVAPVTHWKFYDTIYTERFMQKPEQNPEGYRKGSPITYAGQIQSDYLIVHGTGDDNVHFQNTTEFANKLISRGVDFDTFFYPNRDHSIYGNNARPHLFFKLTEFVLKNL